jgi:uncharacterized glyoxalase superfamily protein PhnB
MSNTINLINSANPSFLITACEALRVLFTAKYKCRDTKWTAYFVSGNYASIKDEFGTSWDINLINNEIIPA